MDFFDILLAKKLSGGGGGSTKYSIVGVNMRVGGILMQARLKQSQRNKGGQKHGKKRTRTAFV